METRIPMVDSKVSTMEPNWALEMAVWILRVNLKETARAPSNETTAMAVVSCSETSMVSSEAMVPWKK